MSIYRTLRKEHRRIVALIEHIRQDQRDDPFEVERAFSGLQEELSLHMEGEEKVLYPVLLNSKRTHASVLEANEEHHVVKVLLNELNRLPKDDERWMAKLKVMEEAVRRHVQEEESAVFREARQVISEKQADAIDRGYEDEKKRYMAMAL